MKRTIRLNESQLNRVIKETVKKVLNEQFAGEDKEGRREAIRYLKHNDYNWVTVEFDHTYGIVRIYQGQGLDFERDQIEPEQEDDYTEMMGHEVLDIVKERGYTPILMEV